MSRVPSGPPGAHHVTTAVIGISRACTVAEHPRLRFAAVGVMLRGTNGATSAPYPGGPAGRSSRRSGHVAMWWLVLYGSGVGDPRDLGGSELWRVVGQGITVLPGCRMRVVRRAAKISLTRAACAARSSSAVWMAGDTCPAANARIWWIAKTGHTFSVVGGCARSWGGMISACCQPSRWSFHVPDHSLVCCHLRSAHRHRQ